MHFFSELRCHRPRRSGGPVGGISCGKSSLLVCAELSPAGFWPPGFAYSASAKRPRESGNVDPVLNPSVTRHVNAAKITRQSKSNLALAFIAFDRERKRDITVFYAFCRVIDDIADSAQFDAAQKQIRLAAWREILRGARGDEPLLAREMRDLIDKYSLPIEMLEEIIDGVEMDLSSSAMPRSKNSAFTAIGSPARSVWSALRFSDIAMRAAKNMRSSLAWLCN